MAEPTATPPAVAAIWANNPGCWGAAAAAGGGWAGGAAGCVLAGKVLLALKKYVVHYSQISIIHKVRLYTGKEGPKTYLALGGGLADLPRRGILLINNKSNLKVSLMKLRNSLLRFVT